jgi:uncharacterized protein YbjT (DUF2867 family)
VHPNVRPSGAYLPHARPQQVHVWNQGAPDAATRSGPYGRTEKPTALRAGDTPEPFVDVDDIADVAVAALTDDRHIGEVYELTGPRLLTFTDAVGEIAKATGRDIRYEPVPIEEHAATAREQGVPAEDIDLLTYLFGEVLDGRNAHVTDGVERALGRPPRDFADDMRDIAATGVWNPGSPR